MAAQIPEKMQAVVCHGPHDYRLEEVAVPQRGPGEALIKVEAVGICASDLKCYHGAAKFWGDENRPAWAETMVIPGHEFAGRVVDLDDAAAALGDRGRGPGGVRADRAVLGMPLLQARPVPHVSAARLYGFKRRTPGAMASYMVYPAEALVHKVSADVAPQHAAFAEPLSCSLHAVERAQIMFEDVVVVAGCGPIGLGMVAGARAKNPMHVIALDMAPEKLELAKLCGADITINIAEQDAVAIVKDLTGGYGATCTWREPGTRPRSRRGSTCYASWAGTSSTACSAAT